MFRGEHYNSLDVKGRTSIPARLRTVFTETFVDERFVITKCLPVNTDKGEVCRGLAIYPLSEFQSLEQKFEKGNGLTVAALNGIRRHVFAPAVECIADKQHHAVVLKPEKCLHILRPFSGHKGNPLAGMLGG